MLAGQGKRELLLLQLSFSTTPFFLLINTFNEKSMCTINVAVHLCFVINKNLIIITTMVIMVTCSFSSCWLLVTKEALASLLLKPITRLVILSTSSVNSRTCKKMSCYGLALLKVNVTLSISVCWASLPTSRTISLPPWTKQRSDCVVWASFFLPMIMFFVCRFVCL